MIEHSELVCYAAIAERLIKDAENLFCQNIGAQPSIIKNEDLQDFATDVDLSLEQQFCEQLVHETGFPVLGEEFGLQGGVDVPAAVPSFSYHPDDYPTTMWCVDPVDGTSNYAVANPMCAILVSLIHRGEPVIGMTALPMLGKFYSAVRGGPLLVNGEAVPRLPTQDPGVIQIGFGSILSGRRGRVPRQYRQNLLFSIGESYPRMRVTGSVGADLAFTASGVFAGTLTFSPNWWDNAAGICLVEAAGGVVTNLNNEPWTPGTIGLVAGSPSVHSTLLSRIHAVPRPFEPLS
ncbi:inositol monophosphatase family protein [Corynebacterium kroppenstedtii]|uniref:inositol monophosphatase family protein n=1 Tax=Corynebacterium sp. PCR 32 TaxID=3351342 RepID=UPI003095895F